MKTAFAAAVLAVAAIATVPAAEARGFGRFGEEDNFNKIQDLTIPSEIDRADLPPEWLKGIELDSHTVTHWVGAGLWLEDVGYAIRVPGSDDYWELNAELTKGLQDLKVLPDPLPKYEIPVMDYVFGYSLWIVIAVLALWYGVSALLKRNRPAPADVPPAGAPPSGA
jgi:uncharacterized protein